MKSARLNDKSNQKIQWIVLNALMRHMHNKQEKQKNNALAFLRCRRLTLQNFYTSWKDNARKSGLKK